MILIQDDMRIERENGVRIIRKNGKKAEIKVSSYEYTDGLLIETFELFIENTLIVSAERNIYPLYSPKPDVMYKDVDKLLSAIKEYLQLNESEIKVLKEYFAFSNS